MSEFLKNFRSSHSRYSGNKRSPYDGHYYPAQERRNGNDRRSTDAAHTSSKASNALYSKLEEFLPKLQLLLETITDNQQLLIELKERQTQSGEMMAEAFKDIAAILSNAPAPSSKPAAAAQADDSSGKVVKSVKDLEQTEMKSSADEKKDVIRIMKKLRKKGGTYKEIANFLNENNIPTFSNKGHWHAQTIHRLCSR